ncbi:L-histidine N(alpha)-methyltransferase [Usitatibacter palustris]|uniref:Histidine N-alpha-methyltransferase n=1 Tax=Usitatibacter palustris TaxID=2732487 RepID=A0A6M4H4N6_9PROT|nr:L-histidine N(alpha)-methyltransferase [Usitatibacter palustris]QJR14599.1 Histidine N-alpha-methyltransferase [Usitatibacter palustris]
MSSVVHLKKPAADARGYSIVHRPGKAIVDERAEVVAGLLAAPARIAPKYFYDELGCALYGAICQLPEYYPTRTEIAIFRDFRSEIAEAVGQGGQFVDLGAGDCCKAEAWLPFLNPARYLAVDIAGPEIERALSRMAPDFPGTELVGVVTDFTHGVDLEGLLDEREVTFFYPGSSIGNFSPEDARALLASIHRACATRPGSGLLIGVDGKKEKALLDAAYDDALGVTASFNRNILLHLNRRFGFDFALDAFTHRGFYNETAGRVEMHLEAVSEQVVKARGYERTFAKGERIHTENSYKYTPGEVAALLQDSGFTRTRRWSSPGDGYSVFYAS